MSGMVLKRLAALGLIGAMLGGGGITAAAAATCEQPAGEAALADGLLQWINEQRVAHGARPYARSAKLDRAAAFHACDMATRGYFAHSRPDGPKLGTRIKATGYPLKAGNENIAYSRQAAVSSAATIWRNSPPHWAAIIDPSLKEIGISLSESNGRIYWVMDVARPKGS